MTYILISMWIYSASRAGAAASITVEFNDLKSCQAAAALISKQRPAHVLICAAKGEKK